MSPGQPNGQQQGDGAEAWAERWDKGEGAMGWSLDLGQGVGQGLGSGGILISPRNILRGIL